MLNIPKGVWSWIDANMKDLSRIASALEQVAEELAEIRKALQDERKG